MICTNCGKEVPKTAKVCGYCGHRLAATVAPREMQAAGYPRRDSTEVATSKLGILKVVSGVAFLAIIFILWKLLSPSPTLPSNAPNAEPTSRSELPTGNPRSTSPTSPPADQEAVTIYMFWDEAEVPAGANIVLYGGWEAATQELVLEFFDSVEAFIQIDGEPYSIGALFLEDVQFRDVNEDGEESLEDTYVGYWYQPPIDPLNPGQHIIEIEITYSHPITDGFDLDGDGEEDIYSETETHRLVLTVK